LIKEGQLAAYRHDGFWMPMDTFKDKQTLEDMYSRDVAPWEVWKNNGVSHRSASVLVTAPQADGEAVF
jgi:glucose-1-phosphate cytidylyltransferase